MRLVSGFVLVGVLTLGGLACSSDSGDGAEIRSNAALQGLMQTVALDFAQVLADVAPDPNAVFSEKQLENTTSCPQGGAATWTETQFGGGNLALDGCQMKGITVTGNLAGFLSSFPDAVSADMLSGAVTTSGGFSAQLNVTSMTVSAQLPIADATTYWEVYATSADGEMLCAWSGGDGCAPSMF